MPEYYTIVKPGSGEYEEKKSRFLGVAIPVTTQDDVRTHLERIRKQYYDARHHCYAYVLGESRSDKKASDDGEPQGTAGQPILKVIEGAECTNVLVVVTRYFGGTLLGTGGLVRAYTQAAKAALQDAQPVQMQPGEIVRITAQYPQLDRINYLLEQEGLAAGDIQYTDQVSLSVTVPSAESGKLRERLQALGSGSIAIETEEKGFYAF